ncbi:MAG: hypothetical protein BroJett013_36450 [Alphaproteobacteria bacterium]|nr:MAG: hypothetical protein BroJett013_36450 [Alphaproteobacteria bacterium]
MRDEFVRAFDEAFETAALDAADLTSCYARARSWTQFMLGEQPRGVLRLAVDLWAKMCGYDAPGACSPHAQWYTLDLCVVAPAYAGDGDYWKSRTVLALEHENDSDVETEMWKLAHWRAELSVLVFCDFSEAERRTAAPAGDRWLKGVTKPDWLEKKLERLSAIVKAVDGRSAERHLLVIGEKSVGDPATLQWRASVWDGAGFAEPCPIKDAWAR